MATAVYLLSDRVATGFADERLADVALRLARSNAHHLVIIHEFDKTFVGLITLADIAAHGNPGNRILGDLASKTMPVIVGSKDSASIIVDMFERHRLGEAIVTNAGIYVGLITAESILQWNYRQRDNIANIPLSETTFLGTTERLGSSGLQPHSPSVPAGKENAQAMVLLVEDHLSSRKALSSILARRNLKVVEADSVQEALKLFGQHAFALVISDIGLPDASGFELMVQLRRQSNVKAISITAFSDQNYSVQSQAAGFSFHFTKPLNIRILDAAIQEILGARTAKLTAEPNI